MSLTKNINEKNLLDFNNLIRSTINAEAKELNDIINTKVQELNNTINGLNYTEDIQEDQYPLERGVMVGIEEEKGLISPTYKTEICLEKIYDKEGNELIDLKDNVVTIGNKNEGPKIETHLEDNCIRISIDDSGEHENEGSSSDTIELSDNQARIFVDGWNGNESLYYYCDVALNDTGEISLSSSDSVELFINKNKSAGIKISKENSNGTFYYGSYNNISINSDTISICNHESPDLNNGKGGEIVLNHTNNSIFLKSYSNSHKDNESYSYLSLIDNGTNTSSIKIGKYSNKNDVPLLELFTHKAEVKVEGTITATQFNASSDKRLKENITPYKCNNSILDLPVYEFDYRNSKIHTIGCLAQDLQEICPEIVSQGEDGYLSISENKLIYLLLDEVKRLNSRIEVLEKERV